MRDTMSLRGRHWLLLGGAVLAAAIYGGLLDIRGMAAALANRADVVRTFEDPDLGRADAMILVFSTLFLGPMAVLLGGLLLTALLAVFGGFLLPVVRWFRLPEWVGTAVALVAAVAVLWAHSEAWLPRSLWFVGLVARACRVVIAV